MEATSSTQLDGRFTPKEYDTQLPFGTRKPQGGPVVIVQPTPGLQ